MGSCHFVRQSSQWLAIMLLLKLTLNSASNEFHGDTDHFRWQKHMLDLKDHQGNTALHLAVMGGVTESVQLMLQAGANINVPGTTMLHLAHVCGQHECDVLPCHTSWSCSNLLPVQTYCLFKPTAFKPVPYLRLQCRYVPLLVQGMM